MSVAEVSRERVEERLAALEESYSSFPVNQTTLTVTGAVYERARERCRGRLVDVYVQVFDDDENVLLVEGDGSWVVPHCEPESDERLEAGARRALGEETEVDCRITGLRRATILGVLDEEAPERAPVYRLVAVFVGEHVDGLPGEGAAWHSQLPDSALPTY